LQGYWHLPFQFQIFEQLGLEVASGSSFASFDVEILLVGVRQEGNFFSLMVSPF
jgi:hypothetical protein